MVTTTEPRRSSRARQESVLSLYKLLQETAIESKPPSKALLDACNRQSTLAKFAQAMNGIVPMSLNTLKQTADECFGDGGWKKIDALRISVLKSARKAEPSLSPLAAARQHAADAERRNDEQFQTRALLYRAYSSALTLANEFAEDKPERIEKIKRLHALYADVFDLRRAK
ncbi:hypothetical protein PQQ63_30050 [Paraburkholderia metrosideri]|uniref:Uncharacterized protein n=1 Tax=Paraburkholderia metrosideri TaxID=580937 RepID=A0ABW9E131_9BURK